MPKGETKGVQSTGITFRENSRLVGGKWREWTFEKPIRERGLIRIPYRFRAHSAREGSMTKADVRLRIDGRPIFAHVVGLDPDWPRTKPKGSDAGGALEVLERGVLEFDWSPAKGHELRVQGEITMLIGGEIVQVPPEVMVPLLGPNVDSAL